jgi:hypothetical protein
LHLLDTYQVASSFIGLLTRYHMRSKYKKFNDSLLNQFGCLYIYVAESQRLHRRNYLLSLHFSLKVIILQVT